MYIDPITAIQKLINSGSMGEQLKGQAGFILPMVLQQTGLPQMKAFGSITQPGGEEFETISRSLVYMDQPPIALMRAFQFSEFPTTPPEWVKENAHAYYAGKWQIAEAYNAIEELANEVGGSDGALSSRIDQPVSYTHLTLPTILLV